MRWPSVVFLAMLILVSWNPTAAAETQGLTYAVTRYDDPDPLFTGTGNLCVPAINAQLRDYRHIADCSLREAILTTNRSVEKDLVVLKPGTYVLSMIGPEEEGPPAKVGYSTGIYPKGAGGMWTGGWVGDLDISADLVIQGAGSNLTTINADFIDRVFDIHAQVTISGVTIRNGLADERAGGGIHNTSNLTLIDVVIVQNNASAGAGIFNSSTGNLFLQNSLVADNHATHYGGGVYNAPGSQAVIANTTVSGNSALIAGGGFWNGGSADLRNLTIADNAASTGGGIFNLPRGDGEHPRNSVRLANSILALNIATATDEDPDPDRGNDCSGAIASAGHNLVADIIGCNIQGDSTGNLIRKDPKLGLLNSGGDSISTHALLAGSPAINSGNPTAPGTHGKACERFDQRGLYRPQGDRCDMGAFEAELADLEVASSRSIEMLWPGAEFIYEVVVTNLGPSTANNTILSVFIPENADLVSSENSFLPCTLNNDLLQCAVGDIPTHTSTRTSVTLRVSPTALDTITNSVSAGSEQIDPIVSNSTITERIEVKPQIDLSITFTESILPATAGSQVTSSWFIANYGPSAAKKVIVEIAVPLYLKPYKFHSSQGECAPVGTVTICKLGRLDSGSDAVIKTDVMIPSSITQPITITAVASSPELDTNSNNNSGAQVSEVQTNADLSISAQVPTGPIYDSNNLAFQISVKNNGPSDAAAVSFTQTVPPIARFLSVSGTAHSCKEQDGIVTCNLGALVSGETVNSEIVLSLQRQGNLVSSVAVNSIENDLFPSNDTTRLQVSIAPTPSSGWPMSYIIIFIVGAFAIIGGIISLLVKKRQ